MGIEPTAQAWEAWVLPLYDARSRRLILGKGDSSRLSSAQANPGAGCRKGALPQNDAESLRKCHLALKILGTRGRADGGRIDDVRLE